MERIYTSLGLMSGTSMDGVDVSVIESDGISEYSSISDKYFEYDQNLYLKILKIRQKINNKNDLTRYNDEIQSVEREITLFNAKVTNETIKSSKSKIDLIGFHGQTIFHSPKEKTTKQLGDGKLLSQLVKKKVVYDFRQNDIKNGGQGAPLTPIFHNILANRFNQKFNISFPIYFLNIGGITNITKTVKDENLFKSQEMQAYDIAPGNCLIDDWIKKNSNKKYDHKGSIARSGKPDELILNQAIENFTNDIDYNKSLDIKDYDISFVKGLPIDTGAATITNFTAKLISDGIKYVYTEDQTKKKSCIVCGGGRKNDFLLERIKKNLESYKNLDIELIEKYKINGDFVESQAFAYLAIRTIKNLSISFPSTTRCPKPLTGGKIIENF